MGQWGSIGRDLLGLRGAGAGSLRNTKDCFSFRGYAAQISTVKKDQKGKVAKGSKGTAHLPWQPEFAMQKSKIKRSFRIPSTGILDLSGTMMYHVLLLYYHVVPVVAKVCAGEAPLWRFANRSLTQLLHACGELSSSAVKYIYIFKII